MNLDSCVLCAEDDEDACELMKTAFELVGYKTNFCDTAAEAIGKAQTMRFAAIVLDYGLKDTDGIEACKEIRKFDFITPIVFYTGQTRDSLRLLAIANGANAYLIKPTDFPILVQTVLKLIRQLNIK